MSGCIGDGEAGEVGHLDFSTVDGDAHSEVGREECYREHGKGAEEEIEEAVDGEDLHGLG